MGTREYFYQQYMVPYLTLTDLELVDLLKKDDSDAFSEIYSRYAVFW